MGHIHILDTGTHCLYKFSSSGNYLQQIGSRGSGPAEFLNPNELIIVKDHLYVNEIDNYRIQKLSLDGIPEKSIRRYLTPYSMTGDEDGLLYIAPLAYGPESRQVIVINEKGEVIRSFGKAKTFVKDGVPLNFVYLEKTNRNEIFAIYRHFPIIRKYSQQGGLLFERRLTNAAMTRVAKINLKKSQSGARLRKGYILNVIATSMLNDHLFLLCHKVNPFILEYDDQGVQVGIYRINRTDQYMAKSFVVTEDENKNKIFHLLQVFPESIVDIYSESSDLQEDVKDE